MVFADHIEDPNLSPRNFITDEAMGWAVYLRGNKRIVEGEHTGTLNGRPSYSTDAIPSDQVVAVGYYPLRPNLPKILCLVDPSKGERFVRYWTTVWMNGRGTKRLYVLGWYRIVDGAKKYNLLLYYPQDNKIALSTNKLACPPYDPDTFCLLHKHAVVNRRSDEISWTFDGESAHVFQMPGGMLFRSGRD